MIKTSIFTTLISCLLLAGNVSALPTSGAGLQERNYILAPPEYLSPTPDILDTSTFNPKAVEDDGTGLKKRNGAMSMIPAPKSGPVAQNNLITKPQSQASQTPQTPQTPQIPRASTAVTTTPKSGPPAQNNLVTPPGGTGGPGGQQWQKTGEVNTQQSLPGQPAMNKGPASPLKLDTAFARNDNSENPWRNQADPKTLDGDGAWPAEWQQVATTGPSKPVSP
ncbi:Hypothetical protein D9617_14g077020 [Elsinoe fawcettii]|nr:Hypothetical protein D9617_14g077020 [Elsinoe fawcettii]